jgi:uncharacterized membrane protein YhaH (DUF805 family)
MKMPSGKMFLVFAMTVVVMVVAGLAFVYKMGEFAFTIAEDEVSGFGAVAVTTYLIGMLPILFLTLWAVLTGRFRDIERPKYRMLELNEELDRAARRS